MERQEMKRTFFRWLVYGILLRPAYLPAPSMVWNFRIAEVTRQPIGQPSNKYDSTIITLLFDQYRKKYNDIQQQFVGALWAGMCGKQDYYLRIDTAFASIHAHGGQSTPYVGTQLDDILISFGKGISFDAAVVTCSGLFGIPTHRIFNLEHVSFGYNQVGTGIQVDGAYSFAHSNGILLGWRYIYFCPRCARDTTGQQYKFTIGNITDVLVAYRQRWHSHGLETGYTLRCRFGAAINPNLDDTTKKTDYMRSNLYFIYKYHFDLDHSAHRLLFNISWGHDHRPKIYGNKYIVTLWASWNINF